MTGTPPPAPFGARRGGYGRAVMPRVRRGVPGRQDWTAPMPTRIAVLVIAACTLLAACTRGDPDFDRAAATTTAAPTTTTSVVPPTTSPPTTAPAPAPPLAGTTARAVVSPHGIVVPVIGPAEGGVRVGMPCGGTAVL